MPTRHGWELVSVRELAERPAADALSVSQGLPPAQAHKQAQALLDAEERRFWWLYSAVREDELSITTSHFARALDRFRRALTTWTASSARYALAAPGGGPA
ncbi:hypothetical protein [Kitasatospora kifunensis]|uniref:Uncharacterized protein n=1 Tax=Kitasatospora kifunensis TaxID=58351 RepID=A0A7W7R371_KITKI|nr:hypothetical protein [Kitasatospora kifunensis]MBB4924349.1 hypothetical protein [Kitasatospora kifunensis]